MGYVIVSWRVSNYTSPGYFCWFTHVINQWVLMGVKVIKPGPQESSTLFYLNVLLYPMASLYGIFTNIWLIYMGHGGEYFHKWMVCGMGIRFDDTCGILCWNTAPRWPMYLWDMDPFAGSGRQGPGARPGSSVPWSTSENNIDGGFNLLYFLPYIWKWFNLTNVWNYHLVDCVRLFFLRSRDTTSKVVGFSAAILSKVA